MKQTIVLIALAIGYFPVCAFGRNHRQPIGYDTIGLGFVLSSFSTQQKQSDRIELQWTIQIEHPNRCYEVQKSTNGQHFTTIAQLPAIVGPNETGVYTYYYHIQPTDDNRLHFRLKQIESNTLVSYSTVCIVDVISKKNKALLVYPNPAVSFANLLFTNKKRSNWQIELVTANGQVIQQYHFQNIFLAQLTNLAGLQKGTYSLRATNTISREQMAQQLVIQ